MDDTRHLAFAPDDTQYLRHLLALGDTRPLLAHTAIFTHHGIKLVERGTHLNSGALEKLILHKLLPPIDECLSVADPVCGAGLAAALDALLEEAPGLASLLPEPTCQVSLRQAFAQLGLSPAAQIKLTVAREQRPELYRHSIEVAFCAAALGCHEAEHGTDALPDLVVTGLFHDLGLLHIDPRVLDPDHPLDAAEQRQLYAHPLTGSLILSGLKEWSEARGTAILEHHERLDGSGYPRGLSAHELAPMGQLLAVAELAATLLGRQAAPYSARRLAVVLRLNRGKLHPLHVDRLARSLLRHQPPAPSPTGGTARETAAILAQMVALAVTLEHWRAIHRGREEFNSLVWISQRIERLEHSLADAGLDLTYWSGFTEEAQLDDDSSAELLAAAGEARWQLRSIVAEIRRRWPELRDEDDTVLTDLRLWMGQVEADATQAT